MMRISPPSWQLRSSNTIRCSSKSPGISLLDVDAFDDAREPALQVAGNQEETLRLGRITEALAKSIAALPIP